MNKIFISVLFFAAVLGSGALAESAGQNVESAKGKAKFNTLLQFWGLNDTSAQGVGNLNFRVRRAEIKFSGSLDPQSKWFIKVDPAKALSSGAVSSTNDNKILQDIGMSYSLCEGLELQVGQFKAPNTWEGLDSSADLWFPERSLVARTYGDKRQTGAMVSYKVGMVQLQTMISNSGNSNTDDTNTDKDLNFRAVVSPTDLLKFAAFVTAGDFQFYDKGRFGADVRLDYDGFEFRGEYVRAVDQGVGSNAFVVDAGYRLSDLWMPIARYTYFATGSNSELGLGVNYYLSQFASKIQLAYSYLNNMRGNNGSPALASGATGSVLWLAFQVDI